MKNLFSYDNKFMQMLMTVGDLVILNVMFLVFSIPLVTIGAAQAGLYNGVRVLVDKDDDSSPAAAFFRGFTNGFWKITGVWTVLMVLIGASAYLLICVYLFDLTGISGAPVVLSIISLCVLAVFQTLICLFHSRFGCTVVQLFRNAWLILLAHPIRSLLVTALTWAPFVVLLIDFKMFIGITPLLMTLLYSFLFMLGWTIMHKPFQDLLDMYNEKNNVNKDASAESDAS